MSWYEGGLRFACTGCGRCCMHGDGYVWIAEDEIVALAAHLGMALDDFGRRYLRRVGNRYAFVDGRDGACIFLSEKACSIYDHRPAQCRTYPWWPGNLESPEAWAAAAESCEGISDVAPVVVADVIERALAESPYRAPARARDEALAPARTAASSAATPAESAPDASKRSR